MSVLGKIVEKKGPLPSFAPEKGDKSHLPLIGEGTSFVTNKKLLPKKGEGGPASERGVGRKG
jgi:hypothetical protein